MPRRNRKAIAMAPTMSRAQAALAPVHTIWPGHDPNRCRCVRCR